jgi:hypothetical protein
MTAKELQKKYTRVVKVGDWYNTYLQVDCQGVLIAIQRPKVDAIWYSKMVGIMLEKIVKEVTNEPI